jgi:signal transduction histidine kinase
LQEDIARALEGERERAIAAAAGVRAVGSAVFVLLVTITWRITGAAGWAVYVRPLTFYALVSALLFIFRTRAPIRRTAWLVVILDVWVVAGVQLRTMPLSQFPSGVAGFSLGLFGLLVVLNAMTFSGPVIYLAATVSFLAQACLMYAADVGAPAIISAGVVLALEARVLQVLSSRLRAMLQGLASSDVERLFEHRKVAEIEKARTRIESLLEDSRRQNERLRELQEEKERLTQLLVHDLRSPLMALKGSAASIELHLREQSALGDVSEDIDLMRDTVRRLTGMTEDILRVGKLEEGKLEIRKERIAILPLLRAVKRQTERINPYKSLQIEVDAAEDLTIEADPGLVTRVIENLAANATRYTPTRGVITLSASRSGAEVVLAVNNQGTPIASELRGRLFEKYQQAHNERGGMGLGLYFCRLAVEGHGGTIAVEDVPGWATSFVIRLPARG